ncbi:histidine phosphatase family protein [Oceanobacillus sp. CAU 1775]
MHEGETIITKLCIIRHGETDWNVAGILQGKQDTSLNDRGKKQAHACGEYLQPFDWDIIITSPLRRARETAEIIQQQIRIPLIEMSMFAERGFGEAEGILPVDRDHKFPDQIYPGEESLTSFTNKILLGMESISRLYSGKRVLLITHGATINVILAAFSNDEIDIGTTTIKNGCMNNLEYSHGCWKIKEFNKIEHLAAFCN